MRYQEFLCAVEKELNKRLKEGIKASVYTAVKNNSEKKKGVIIERAGNQTAPTIYLEGFFIRFQQGESMENLIEEIVTFYESIGGNQIWDPTWFEEYSEIKSRIVFKLVHKMKNKELLKKVPYIDVLDLAIVFYVFWDLEQKGIASIQISNEHLEKWRISREALFAEAMKNVKILLPAEFFSMQHAIAEMMEATENGKAENLLYNSGKNKKDVMYVLTNPRRNYGAACIIYPHVLEMIGDLLEEDYYILPSSVHEVIIVPESRGLDPDEMDEMVNEINETQVEPEEVLSSHSYFYQRKGDKLMIRHKEGSLG